MRRHEINWMGRRIFLIGIMMFAIWMACCINDPCSVSETDFSVRDSFYYELRAKAQQCLRINGINGPIDIAGNPNPGRIEIWGDRIVKSESIADAEAYLSRLEVSVSSNQDEVYVKTIQPKQTHGRHYEVVYHVRIPQSWQVVVENLNGEVSVDSLKNDVSVELTNGNVHLRDIYGNLWVEVINGVINSKVKLPFQGNCQMYAVNGQIELAIPKQTSANISACVVNGNIDIDDLILKNCTITKNSTNGTLADGDGTIMLKLVNGQIKVKGF